MPLLRRVFGRQDGLQLADEEARFLRWAGRQFDGDAAASYR